MPTFAQHVAIVLCAALSAAPGECQGPPGHQGPGAQGSGASLSPGWATGSTPAPSGQPVEQPADLNICGPLALAAAASYLGRPELFDPVFSLLPASGKPRTLNELQAAALELGA